MADDKATMTKKVNVGGNDLTIDQVRELLASADGQLEGATDAAIAAAAEKLRNPGVLPKRALGITDAMMEGIYSHAYNMYNRGLYKDGSNIFRLLLMLDFHEAKYLMGLAACLHMLKNYEDAAQMYWMTSAMDTENPLPFYHAADCYMQVNKPTAARKALEFAIETAGTEPRYVILVERAKLMHEALKGAAEEEMRNPPSAVPKKKAKKEKTEKKSKGKKKER